MSDHLSDPPTALWRQCLRGKSGDPLRSSLARTYRKHLGEDWRDYYTGPYEDDGPNIYEDEGES